MGFGKTLRERYKFIRVLVNAQKTVWYPVLFAALCTVSGINDHKVYIPILWVLTSFILFSVLFTDDNKVFLPPLLMIFCSLGIDTDKHAFTSSGGELLSFYDPGAFKQIMIICVICVGAFVVRLIADGSIKRAFTKRRFFSFSILFLDAAFLLNGVLSPKYSPINLLYGAIMALGFTVVYFFVSGMLDESRDPITYACYSMVATAYVALCQVLYIVLGLIKADNFLLVYSNGNIIINRGEFVLGWGISTVIAAVFVLGIPAALYLAKDKKACLFSFLSATLFAAGTIIVNTRSAIVVGILSYIFGVILCCMCGKNRIYNRIFTAVMAIAAIAVYLTLCFDSDAPKDFWDKIVHLFRFTENSDSGRIPLWKNGIEDFRSSPLFGVGFDDGAYDDALRSNNIFSNMYHCLAIQFPAALGAFGSIAFLVHLAYVCYLCFNKINVEKVLLLTVSLMIMAMSLVDNFFFYFNFQIFYCVFLVCAEKVDLKNGCN